MLTNPIRDLLLAIHHNVDALCNDLALDRPDLAAAVRRRAASIPRPDEPMAPQPATPPRRSVARLGPLLYDALDEGVIDAREFDGLMLDRNRASRALDARAQR